MEQYKIEVQGLNTYRVYECRHSNMLDTVAVGMMQNNSISGLLPMQVLHMDNTCSLKFNISSRVTLKQFLTGVVGKERFIKVIRHIVETLLQMEEYLLDIGCLQFCTEDIYVNVSTLETEMLYFPVLGQEQQVNLNSFLKEILFSTEFDRSENCDYVVSFLHFLNTNKEVDIVELKKMTDGFLVQKTVPTSPAPAMALSKAPVPPPDLTIASAMESPLDGKEPVPKQEEAIRVSAGNKTATPVKQPHTAVIPKPEAKPKQEAKPKREAKPKPEKKGMFGKKKKEKQKQQQQAVSIGIEIPGMKPVEAVPETVSASETGERQPDYQIRRESPAKSGGARQRTPLTNFGETTVLQSAAVGETTILGMENVESIPKQYRPVLERKRTQETIPITKECFRLGKEQQYVDYCIADNTAVSRSHADIVKKGEDYYITDNNSLNHTFVNGLQVPAQNPQILQDGDLVTLANEEFIYKLLS